MLSVEASYCILVGTGNGFFIFMFIYAIPYIANHLRCKSCAVTEINWKHSLWPNPIAQEHYCHFTGKFRGYRSIHENCKTFHLEPFIIYGN